MLRILRTSSPWRDLPEKFGKWGTVYQRFRRWDMAGVLDELFEGTKIRLDVRSVQVDGTYVKAHQHAAGAPTWVRLPDESRRLQAIGRNRGGLTTKLIVVTDDLGRLADFTVVPGNAGEAREPITLLADVQTGEVLADKAYDTNAVRATLASRRIVATIPGKRFTRRQLPLYSETSYRRRHLVENLFADLKQFRSLATRYCKLASWFRAMVLLAGWFLDRHDDRSRGWRVESRTRRQTILIWGDRPNHILHLLLTVFTVGL